MLLPVFDKYLPPPKKKKKKKSKKSKKSNKSCHIHVSI